MTKKEKEGYDRGVRDALDIVNYHYFGKRLGDEKRTRKNMRIVMSRAQEKGTSVPAFWNFIKGIKEEIGSLIGLSKEEIIGISEVTETTKIEA